MSKQKTYWERELEPKVLSIINEDCQRFHETEFQKSKELDNKIAELNNNYKNNYSKAKVFFLYLSIILFFWLIVPDYWIVKKINYYKKIKKNYQKDYDNLANEKINFLRDAINSLNPTTTINKINKFINLKIGGQIDHNATLMLGNSFAYSIYEPESICPISGHWYSFHDKLLVLHTDLINLEMVNQMYTGYKTIYYKTDDGYSSAVITGVCYAPRPEFTYDSRYWFYTKALNNLDACITGVYPNANRKISKNEIRLENEEFDKSFSWAYNDNVQFRMLFTPHFQDLFVKEAFNIDDIIWFYKIRVYPSFITLDVSSPLENLDDLSLEIPINENTTLISIEQEFNRQLHIYASQKIQSLYPGYIIPILQQENHKNEFEQLKKSTFLPNEVTFLSFFYNQFQDNSIQSIASVAQNISNLNLNNGVKLYQCPIKRLTFNATKQIYYDYVYSHGQSHSVPVEYIQYDPVYRTYQMYLVDMHECLFNKYLALKNNSTSTANAPSSNGNTQTSSSNQAGTFEEFVLEAYNKISTYLNNWREKNSNFTCLTGYNFHTKYNNKLIGFLTNYNENLVEVLASIKYVINEIWNVF